MKSKTKAKWGSRTILDAKHIPDLEYAAAIHEFGSGLPRDEAEAAAHSEYAAKHHQEAAAFHLRGMRAAQAAGDLDQSHKHGILFGLHMGVLGHDPLDKVPGTITSLIEAEDKPTAYKFKAHKADGLFTELLEGGPGDNKPDSDFDAEALKEGIKDEHKEHGGPVQVAKEIAKDHLAEDPKAY